MRKYIKNKKRKESLQKMRDKEGNGILYENNKDDEKKKKELTIRHDQATERLEN